MPYSAESYLALFDSQTSIDDALERIRYGNIKGYRAKTIKSGPILEMEAYPIWSTQTAIRGARQKITKDAQRALNKRNTQKKIIRLVNTNFTEADIAITLTFSGKVIPNIQEARRQIQNYIRRVKRWRSRNGLDELKYLYVIEGGVDGYRKRIHLHVIMSDMDRDVAERLWRQGYANARRLQANEYGFEALARYMTKEQTGEKRWAYSQNLQKPTITKSDKKLSRRQVERMVMDFEGEPAAVLHRLYKGYEFLDCEIQESKYVSGAYIYARMRRKEKKNATVQQGKKTPYPAGEYRAGVPI